MRSIRAILFVIAVSLMAALTMVGSPAATAAEETVDDAVTSGPAYFTYTGGSWTACGGCNSAANNGSYRYAYRTGDQAVLAFSGSQATIHGFKEPPGGIAAFAVDGGSTTEIDYYAATQTYTALYTTPILSNTTHTITITVTGRRSAGLTPTINIDKATITTSGTPPPTTPTPSTTTPTSTPTTTTPTPPTTTPPTTATSTPPPATGTTIDDAVTSGPAYFTYTGGSWTACGGCNSAANNGSYRYAYRTGDQAVLAFSGSQATIHGFKEPPGGIAAFAVDGGSTTEIDYYAATQTYTALYTTPILSNTTHTITITVTGRRSAGLTPTINIDKATITTSGTPPPTTPTPSTTTPTSTPTTTTPTPPTTTPPTTATSTPPPATGTTIDDAVTSGPAYFTYTGGSWTACGGCNSAANNGSYRYAYRTGDQAVLAFSGSQATIHGFKEPPGGIAAIAVDGGSTTEIDYYAATQTYTALYTTPTLSNTTHTITITVTGRRSAGLTPTINIDKATITTSGTPPPTTPTPSTTTPTSTPTTTTPTPPPATQGMASITFDDGTIGQHTYARPALVQRSLRATFFIVSDALGWAGTNMNATQVRQLVTDGHEIGNHTRHHSNLTSLTAAQVAAEFSDSQTAITNQVGVSPTACAYPYGAHDASVDAIAAQYFRGCRGTGSGLNTPAALRSYALTTFYVTQSTTAADVRAAADQAKAQHGWVIFTYHGVDPSGSGAEDVTPPHLAEQLDALTATGIAVLTVSEALRAHA